MHNRAHGHPYQAEDHDQVAMGGRGSVPRSPSPLIFRILGEGEPRDEANEFMWILYKSQWEDAKK